jgi:hypothetical protein
MQIHELTKKQLDEASIADTIKSAGSAVKRGAQAVGQSIGQSDFVQQNIKPLAQTAQQGKLASPTAYASNKQAATQAQAAKYAQILQKQGYGTAAATAPAKNPYNNQLAGVQATTTAQGQLVPAATTPPAQPTAPATVTPAGPVAAPQAAQAVNTNQLQAGAVATGGAPAVMLAGDFNAALSGLKLNTNHIKELKDKIAQDASFKNAFLKALGLKR